MCEAVDKACFGLRYRGEEQQRNGWNKELNCLR